MPAGEYSPHTLISRIHTQGITIDPRIEVALIATPRHLFLPGAPLEHVYDNVAIPVRSNLSGEVLCSSSMPSMLATILGQLDLHEGHNVLEIGTGTGFSAALIRHLVGERGTVTTLEIDHAIAAQAQDNLLRASIKRVNVVNVDGAFGYAPRAAYDRIIATVGVWDIPVKWVQQLKPGGRIVAPLLLDGLQVSASFILREDGMLYGEHAVPSAFLYMRGINAGPNVRQRVGSTALMLLTDDADHIDSAALHMLLSSDQEEHRLTGRLDTSDYWYGFLPYLMINEPEDGIFALYTTYDQKAYGIEGEGFVWISAASACFVPYCGRGYVQTFAGSDALLEVEALLARWREAGCPLIHTLRLALYPKDAGIPDIPHGKLYPRQQHNLLVWYDQNTTDATA